MKKDSGIKTNILITLLAFGVMFLLAWMLIYMSTTQQTSYSISDRELAMMSNQDRLASNSEATISASSCWYFLIKGSNGEEIEGVRAERPVGWACLERYTAKEAVYGPGEWTLYRGSGVTLRFQSETSLTVTSSKTPRYIQEVSWLFGTIFTVIWVLLVLFCYLIYDTVSKSR